MKHIFFILFLGGIFFTASGQEKTASPLKMTLQQCIDFALNNSYSRQSVKLNEKAAQDRYNQSTKERLSDLSATVDENLNHSKGNTAAWNRSMPPTKTTLPKQPFRAKTEWHAQPCFCLSQLE